MDPGLILIRCAAIFIYHDLEILSELSIILLLQYSKKRNLNTIINRVHKL